jgi:CheY-like chemotaxis protein
MTATAKRRILIVDDDPLLLQFLGEVLGHAGYETVAASSGPEALQQNRRKINEVAEQLLTAEEILNSLHAGFASRLRPK